MKNLSTFKVNENLFLVSQTLRSQEENLPKPARLQTNFIFVVDVSGSMSGDLDSIRKQLKNKLPSLMNEGDTISIIWFSGNSQAGILKEEVEIRSLTSFDELNQAIDKWLRPIGLTAFCKPLELTKQVINSIKANRPNGLYSLIFLTDGCNNDCSWSGIKSTLKSLESELSSATFVEYGYYADSKALTEMAEIVGGEKIEAETFDKFEPVFDDKIKNSLSSKKELIDIGMNPLYPFCFSLTENNEIIVYSISDGKAMVSSGLNEVFFFSDASNGIPSVKFDASNEKLVKSLYAATYVLSDRTMNQEAEYILASLGDVNIYNTFSNAFGKQKLNAFKNQVKECITESSLRFTKGRSEDIKVDENAYCLLDLLAELGEDEVNLFYPYHKDFKYNRIGAKKVVATGLLTEEEKKNLSGVENIEDLKKLVEELSSKKEEVAEFINEDKDKGFGLGTLVYNDERANISLRAYYKGYVKLPKNKFNLEKVDSFIYRNYTIVKDGIVNVSILPVTLSEATFNSLKIKGLLSGEYDAQQVYLIDLNSIPVINRSLTKKLSAQKLTELEFELLKDKASAKVYSYYEKQLFPRESKSFVDLYGKECEEWLKSIGLTEYNGFNPTMKSVESGDFYMSVNLSSKIKGYSTLSKVEDVENKIKKGDPLKATEQLLEPFVREYLNTMNSPLYLSQSEEVQKSILKSWLEKAKKDQVIKKRKLMVDISKMKFSLILSRGWFVEFSSFDQNSINVKIGDQEITATFDLKEEQVDI